MTKRVLIILMVCIMTIGGSSAVFAKSIDFDEPVIEIETINEDGNREVFSSPLSECGWVEVDSDGNIVATSEDEITSRYTINDSTIGAGNTKYYYPSNDPEGFNVSQNIVVIVSLRLSRAARIRTFLVRGSSLETTDQNPTVYLTPYVSAKMRLGIENKSGRSITVNGTVSW